jgi:Peptidase family M48
MARFRKLILKLSLLSLLPCTLLSADIGSVFCSPGAAVNNCLGAVMHVLRSCSDKRLNPRHENFARQVVDMLAISFPVEFFELSPHYTSVGDHCYGNHIYLDPKLLDWFLANNPDGARFVIAHELSHVRKFHIIQRWLRAGVGAGLIYYLSKKPLDSLGNRLFPYLSETMIRVVQSVCRSAAAFALLYPGIRYLDRLDEKEADYEAICALGKKIGLKRAVAGAEVFFASYDELPSSFLKRALSTHPTREERLAAIYAVSLEDDCTYA